MPNARTEAWGYHYNAMGEREQKRLYDMQGIVEGWDESKPWVYYLLGGSREQLAVYHGREQLAFSCGEPGPGVAFYPVEYNTYSGGTVPLTTRPDPVIANGTKEYRVLDHLGSVRVVLNVLGVASATDYAPFGKAITANEPRQGWIDKEKDRESGLGDFGVRKYEVEEGRFTSIDPLWEKYRRWTPYCYALNHPIGFIDPSGMGSDSVAEGEPEGGAEEYRSEEEIKREEAERETSEGLREPPPYDPLTPEQHEAERQEAQTRRNPYDQMERNSGGSEMAGNNVVSRSLAERIYSSVRSGSGLKPDANHRSASFLSLEQLKAGQEFTITGNDGVQRELLQVNGTLNGKSGIYEYILDPDPAKGVTHQRFISGGVINGTPNQKAP